MKLSLFSVQSHCQHPTELSYQLLHQSLSYCVLLLLLWQHGAHDYTITTVWVNIIFIVLWPTWRTIYSYYKNKCSESTIITIFPFVSGSHCKSIFFALPLFLRKTYKYLPKYVLADYTKKCDCSKFNNDYFGVFEKNAKAQFSIYQFNWQCNYDHLNLETRISYCYWFVSALTLYCLINYYILCDKK